MQHSFWASIFVYLFVAVTRNKGRRFFILILLSSDKRKENSETESDKARDYCE